MDNASEQSSDRELEKPPTLVAQSSGRGKAAGTDIASIAMATISEDKAAKMPVLQPNVNIIGTRTKSGRIHKPARNFSSDDYVVPTLIKRRIPNNSRVNLGRTTPSDATPNSTTVSELDAIRSKLEQKFPKAASDDDETPFTYIIDVCFKENDRNQNMSVADIHSKVKESHKNWTKGPYKLRDDEIKFVQECVVKQEWSRISVKEWRLLAEALKDRMFRMRKRFAKAGRISKGRRRIKEEAKKSAQNARSLKIKEEDNSEEELVGSDEEYEPIDEELEESDNLDQMDDSSTHSSKHSTRSKDPIVNKVRGGGSKTSSVTNDADFDLSLGSVGIDDFAGEDLKEEMFDDLDSALVNESKTKPGGNSMVDALHATLQKDGGLQFDPSQYEPPALEKDGNMFALDDMEVDTNSCNFFDEGGFGSAETPTGMSEETFGDMEQDDDVKPDVDTLSDSDQRSILNSRRLLRENGDRLDLESVEIEESSGNVKMTPGVGTDLANPGVTMISTKIALMCALKISEDFLPSTHEKYLDRLEESDKYRHGELDDIRKKFNIKPSAVAAKRKLMQMESDATKKAKVALKVMNGTEKPKPHPYLRSAYAKCRKFMEDETTVIEKLGNNKILAAGRVIEINYENYLKESDVDLQYDDTWSGIMPNLPPPSASNCHAPCCRLGCICSSISEDMPPRKHCGRPRCFFECNCQNILFNSNDDGDIRSRLRPRVSLLNWRAESTEKEKEPMTSYRQMERGTHFIRMRRTPAQPERLRREFVLDGKVVERNPTKVAKERLRTKALLQSSHRRIMAKPEGHRFMRIVTPKAEHKPKVNLEQMKKKCTPMSIDVEHMNVDIPQIRPGNKTQSPQSKREVIAPPTPPPASKLTAKDVEEMKSIIQEMTEDCQLLALDDKIGFFSWAKGMVRPKVVMYQVMQGDEFKVPWLYLPIPPPGYSWICHYLASSFEKTDYVYIPEVKCCLSSHALRVNMNTAFLKKKPVVFDVKAEGTPPGIGKIYFFPDLAKVLVCGPFKTDQTTISPKDIGNADKIAAALQHMDKLRLLQRFGDDRSWKRFTSAPTIYPIKNRNDNETILSPEESRKLFARLYPSIIDVSSVRQFNIQQQPIRRPMTPKVAFDWSNAVKFVGLGSSIPAATATSSNQMENRNLTEIITVKL